MRHLKTALLVSACLIAACASRPATSVRGLTGAEWRLASLPGHAIPAEADVTLRVDADRAGGRGGVNRYFASWESTAPGKIDFHTIGSTKMAGPAPLMDLETRYFAALDAADAFRITGDRLELLSQGLTIATFERP